MNRNDTPTIFERSVPGRKGYSFPSLDEAFSSPEPLIPQEYARAKAPELPEVCEVDVIRHFTGISRKNYGVDDGFYPLGSCTMKYNPKINENVCRLPGFTALHPLQPSESVQGALEILYELSSMLAEITGMEAVSLNPAAGAHGELTGLYIIKAYHRKRGDAQRKVMLVPDSAHGTNPASATVAGFETREIPSNSRGNVDIAKLREAVGPDTAGLMLTNPNTLGLFEEEILEIAEIVHQAGGLLYYDGANANAIVGRVRPGDMGFDVLHLNLHKTFSTPHGGGGPGSGPVGVSKKLEPFLPTPTVRKEGNLYLLEEERPDSIGRIRSFQGNFGVLLRAYAYLRTLGAEGLKAVSDNAVLNANYLAALLKETFDLSNPDRHCKHEFVVSAKKHKEAHHVTALDFAKGLIDEGYHPPTIYFPLIVEEALMVEPTETEGKESLDRFAAVMEELARKAASPEGAESLHEAPQNTPVTRLDETQAARKPVLRWRRSDS